MSEKRSRKRTAAALAALLIVILLISGAALYPQLQKQWKAPLGPARELPTYTPEPITSTVVAQAPPTQTRAAEDVSVSVPATSLPQVSATLAPTATSQPLCGGPPTMVILGIGADSGV